MDDLQQQLQAVLSDESSMAKVMSMAKSLGFAPSQPEPPPSPSVPGLDPATLGRLMQLAQNTTIDQNQRALLGALRPYLSQDRINRLHRAMQAAKMAAAAACFLPGLQLAQGR